jgi:hypothetical protein
MTDIKILPLPGDLVIIEGTATIGVVTADTIGNYGEGRSHRVIYRKGRKWVRQWIPESALTVVTRAFDIPLGDAYKPEPYAPSGNDADFRPKTDDELTISRGG